MTAGAADDRRQLATVPPTDVASLERYGVSVVTMSGVGHFMMLEDPERFNALLEDVIRRFE